MDNLAYTDRLLTAILAILLKQQGLDDEAIAQVFNDIADSNKDIDLVAHIIANLKP